MSNMFISIFTWLLAASLAALCFSYGLGYNFKEILAVIVGTRIFINLLIIGGKDLWEGKNGGSRVE